MTSASRAAPPWLFSSISSLVHVRRFARSLWVFSPCLKMFTLLASLVAAGSLFQLFTTLWLKYVLWPLFSLSLLLSGSCHSFRVLCCHLKPCILVHFVHLRNNFVRLYPVHVLSSPFQCLQSYLFAFFFICVSFQT